MRRNFHHLYWDVAWYGLLAGTTLAFVTVYITRLGAASWQLGLLNAGPALVGLLFTLPAGRWLHGRQIGRAVLWSGIATRIFFLPMVVLPLLLPAGVQIWAMITLTLVMAIPGTIMAIGFNALYAAAVPPESRGEVAGIRNAVLAVVYVAASLGSGYLLTHTPLTVGYPIVFGLGFLGAAMSTLHIWFLRNMRGDEGIDPDTVRSGLGDHARPGTIRFMGMSVRSTVALRVFSRTKLVLRPEILRTPFGGVIASLLLFHFAQYIPIALFPLLMVNDLLLNDQQISIGTALFHALVLIGSLQLGWLTRRMGNLWLMYMGVIGLSLYPLIMAGAQGMLFYLIASMVGGAAWSMVGGALANYLLEMAPANDRPAYLAWYNLALNAGILAGSLAGPVLMYWVGIRPALLIGFALRLSAALAIWLAGRRALPRVPAAQPARALAGED
jgi:MFS family permease